MLTKAKLIVVGQSNDPSSSYLKYLFKVIQNQMISHPKAPVQYEALCMRKETGCGIMLEVAMLTRHRGGGRAKILAWQALVNLSNIGMADCGR